LMTPLPPRLTLFPYTTLFRSKVAMTHGVPVEVVGRQVGQVAASTAVTTHHLVLAGRDVLVMAREDDQVVGLRERCRIHAGGEVAVGEVIDAAVTPHQPVQEVQVVLTEVRRNAPSQIVPAEPRRGALVPRDVPAVSPAVPVLVLEVVGLPRERGHDHGDAMLADAPR